MPDTKRDILLHFTWSTKYREPLIEKRVKEDLFNAMAGQVTARGCSVLTIGGVADHVHLVVSMRTDVAPSRLIQQVKGISSQFAKDQLYLPAFYWQNGYAVCSVSRSHVPRVVAYVRNQEAHHATGDLIDELEPPDDAEDGEDADG